MNACIFSSCRRYRYTLAHAWHDSWDTHDGYVAWIGLNPSVADEPPLDPTLQRLRSFTDSWGYGRFILVNLFAFRALDPDVLMAEPDPVGPDNDRWILETCHDAAAVVCCWDNDGTHQNRAGRVLSLLASYPLLAFETTARGQPRQLSRFSDDARVRLFRAGQDVIQGAVRP